MVNANATAVVPADEVVSGRFMHLLRPIRDLADSWNIDLAAELEEYVEELASIEISLDGGLSAVNFAEAALLIQGSACIYSKKVEYLYALVYQTLNRVSDKERAPPQTSAVDESGVDVDAPTPRVERDAFLALDDLPEASNLYLHDEAARGDETITSKSPLLVLSTVAELGADAGSLSMRGASMHESGVLLLDDWAAKDPASAQMLHTMLTGMATASGSRVVHMGSALGAHPGAAGPSPNVAGLLTFDMLAALDRTAADGAPPTAADDDYDDAEGFGLGGDYDDVGFDDAAALGGALVPFGAAGPALGRAAAGAAAEPAARAASARGGVTVWTPLDPNDPTGAADLRPFRKGKTWKLPPKSAGTLSALSAGLKRDKLGQVLAPTDAPSRDARDGAALEQEGADEAGDELVEAGDAAAAKPSSGLKAQARAERARVERLSSDWLHSLGLSGEGAHAGWALKGSAATHAEHGALLELEAKRRTSVRKLAREELARHTHVAPAAEAEADADLDATAAFNADAADADARAHDAAGEGPAPFDDDDDDAEFGGGGHELADAPPFDDDDANAAGGDADSQDADGARTHCLSITPRGAGPSAAAGGLTAYEQRYWQQLHAVHADPSATHDADGALHARVSEWEARLLPLLDEQEARRQFDIVTYGRELLDKMPDALGADAAQPPQRKKAARDEASAHASGASVSFAQLMAGQERFEVCRMFLAALQLANNRNIDLVHGDGGADSLSLQLLTRESAFRLEDAVS